MVVELTKDLTITWATVLKPMHEHGKRHSSIKRTFKSKKKVPKKNNRYPRLPPKKKFRIMMYGQTMYGQKIYGKNIRKKKKIE